MLICYTIAVKLADILQEYLINFPNEDKLFSLAKEQIKKQSDAELKSRKNMNGVTLGR